MLNFTTKSIKQATYTDTEGNNWLIYSMLEEVNGWPSQGYYIQKEGYGDIRYVFGYDPNQRSEALDNAVIDYIEDVKGESQYE